MSQYFDVAVLGGGVIGCSAAYHLARKGAKVMVLERRDIGSQASGVSAGMLAAQEEAQAPDVFFDACRASLDEFRSLAPEVAELSGIDTEYEIQGIWRAAATAEEVETLLAKKRWQEERGLAVEWQDAAVVKDIHPGLGECLGAIYCPTDGQVDSARWVQALAEAGRRRGVRFLDQVDGAEFVRDARRVAGVRTREELIAADHFLVAAGAWTPGLLEGLGIALPIEPVKGQLMVLGGMPRMFRGPVYATPGYLIPKPDGSLVVGTTEERVGFNARPTLEAQRFLGDFAARWCPGLRALPVVEFQAALRPGSPDGWPVLGRLWDYDNLFVASGHFRNGILLSPFTGRVMAEGILDHRWDPLAVPFAPDRFLRASAGVGGR